MYVFLFVFYWCNALQYTWVDHLQVLCGEIAQRYKPTSFAKQGQSAQDQQRCSYIFTARIFSHIVTARRRNILVWDEFGNLGNKKFRI